MRNSAVTATDMTSAATIDSQMPSSSQISGKMSTAATWNTSVRKNEMSAEVIPSPSAVKNDEPKIEKPDSRKENEKIENACAVISRSAAS